MSLGTHEIFYVTSFFSTEQRHPSDSSFDFWEVDRCHILAGRLPAIDFNGRRTAPSVIHTISLANESITQDDEGSIWPIAAHLYSSVLGCMPHNHAISTNHRQGSCNPFTRGLFFSARKEPVPERPLVMEQ